MGENEKLNDFNQKFNKILDMFPQNMRPHNSITIDNFTFSFPMSISSFVKRVVKETLAPWALLDTFLMISFLKTPRKLARSIRPLDQDHNVSI